MEKLRINFTISKLDPVSSYTSEEIINTASTCESIDELKATQTAIWNLLWGVILATDAEAAKED